MNELNLQHEILKELEKDAEHLFEMETTEGTIEKVNILITDPYGLKMGFQKQKDGKYRVITSASSQSRIKQQEKIANAIKQRYAYNRVKEELKVKGYTVVEEKNIGNKTIKIVARRWR